tara:strand:+ start:1672 stop:1851 length:180 start_codon:yes stop_codon:yes gene_type:complete
MKNASIKIALGVLLLTFLVIQIIGIKDENETHLLIKNSTLFLAYLIAFVGFWLSLLHNK